MFKIIKRDGREQDFDLKRVKDAIKAAFIASEAFFTEDILDLISIRVTANFQEKIKDGKIVLEDVQDCVENTLEQSGYNNVAKSYILYRKQREKIREMKTFKKLKFITALLILISFTLVSVLVNAQIISGTPEMESSLWKKNYLLMHKFPELVKEVKQLRKELEYLRSKLD